MNTENQLIKMGNQIAQYFASEPDQALGIQGIQNHIVTFWTPAMRRDLDALKASSELHPLLQKALADIAVPA